MDTSDLIASGALIISMLAYLQSATASRKQGTLFGLELDLKFVTDELTGLSALYLGRARNVGQAPIKLEKIVLVDSTNIEEYYYTVTRAVGNSNNLDIVICEETYMDMILYPEDGVHTVCAEYFELKQNEGKELYITSSFPFERTLKEIRIYDTTGRIHRVKGVKKASKKLQKLRGSS